MALSSSVRSLVLLILGLVVGGVGAAMFLESLPGKEGSPEARANQLEIELKRAQNRITALEGAEAGAGKPRGFLGKLIGAEREGDERTLRDGARKIAEEIREGRTVSPNDIFQASQPLLRDLAPLFDRMRLKQQQLMVGRLSGELARKYNLTPQNAERLKEWFAQKTEADAKRWSDLVARDGTRFEEVIRASQNVRPDEGLDTFMQGVLSGDQLTAFNSERMAERAQRVEHEADAKVERLNSIVTLDEAQRDQVFGIIARGSREYDPVMAIEGAQGEIAATQGGDPREAMLAVLRPEQRAAYQAERQRRWEEATKEAEAVGLKLPDEWEMLDGQ